MSDKQPQFEGMTLSNTGDGALEKQFQAHLADVTEIFADADRYKAKKDVVTCKVALEIEFEINTENGLKAYAMSSVLSRPKLKEVAGALFVQDGAVLVEPDRQTNVFELPAANGDAAKE